MQPNCCHNPKPSHSMLLIVWGHRQDHDWKTHEALRQKDKKRKSSKLDASVFHPLFAASCFADGILRAYNKRKSYLLWMGEFEPLWNTWAFWVLEQEDETSSSLTAQVKVRSKRGSRYFRGEEEGRKESIPQAGSTSPPWQSNEYWYGTRRKK